MRVDAPSRESFNEAMLSLNSAQFVEIRLIYKNMRPQTQTQKISLRLTPLLQICAQKKPQRVSLYTFRQSLSDQGVGQLTQQMTVKGAACQKVAELSIASRSGNDQA